MKCTFFGHGTVSEDIRPALHAVLSELIEKRGADSFFVGNNGAFDRIVLAELRRWREKYPTLDVTVVLAYLPAGKPEEYERDAPQTVFPEGLESVPKRYAIDRRNKMMADGADVVITYVRTSCGGAAKFREYARRRGKEIIDL